MSTLIPTASSCHSLQFPATEKDDRLNLNVRTGSASTLYNSLVFTFGGITIGLELMNLSIEEIIEIFQSKISNYKSRNLEKYLSGELFYLNLIEKVWTRVVVPPGEPRPKPRMFHEICAISNSIYVFGGLTIDQGYEDTEENNPINQLVPCNDLWEFNLQSSKWTLLHDGIAKDRGIIPQKRYSHKMTPINSLSFVNKKDHFGILIAGGKDSKSRPIFENAIFDLVEKKYEGTKPIYFNAHPKSHKHSISKDLNYVAGTDDDYNIHVDYLNSIIVNFTEEIDDNQQLRKEKIDTLQTKSEEESIVLYTPTKERFQDKGINPLISFKIGKSIKQGKSLALHRAKRSSEEEKNTIIERKATVPFNLKYPTGGFFGQNIVITGFLPNDFDISIFIYNKPTGKWSRLNVFCNHDYGSHRFWGGFAWQSHHKVVLIGNFLTSRTTSSIRYFSVMITVSLPITNILVSSELSGNHRGKGEKLSTKDESTDDSTAKSTEEDSSSTPDALSEDDSVIQKDTRRNSTNSIGSGRSSTAISFSEYVHYAAPKTNFTTIRSVFPPTAVTLGRNAFDTYGDLISDFEIVSCNGDRIPVSKMVLMERWGRYFIRLLAKGYVKAVHKFEESQKSDEDGAKSYPNGNRNRLKTSTSAFSGSSLSSDSDILKEKIHISLPVSNKPSTKEAPQFRLPFQESTQLLVDNTAVQAIQPLADSPNERPPLVKGPSSVDPHHTNMTRKDSVSSFSSNNSLLTSHLQDIPPQLPLPIEPIPPVPSTPMSFRSSSRRNSSDFNSPRASLIHTLTTLRNIPTSKSPKESPYASPRASVSAQGSGGQVDLFSTSFPNLKLTSDRTKVKSSETSPNASHESIGFTRDLGSSRKESSSTSVASIRSQEKESKNASFSSSLSDSSHVTDHTQAEKEGSHSSIVGNSLLNFENVEVSKFRMEPSLIPRKLYMPFSTVTLKAFCEYLYTGQVGNKWLLSTALDNLAIAKFYKVPLLYDLISEVLFGIIGRKENHVIKEGRRLRKKYLELSKLTDTPIKQPFIFPLDEYEGFMDTVDDGYLDIALLKKTSNIHRNSSAISSKLRKSESRYSSSIDLNNTGEAKNQDSTDDSSDKMVGDEDENIELGFLSSHDTGSVLRSKSAFDKNSSAFSDWYKDMDDEGQELEEQNHGKMSSLDRLVSPNSEIPSEYSMYLIYETGTMTTDMKLTLRSSNAREMSKILEQCKREFGPKIKSLKQKLESQKAEQVRATSEKIEHPQLKAIPSSSSLTSVTSSGSRHVSQLEKTKSNTSFRGINPLTSMKKSDSKLDNKELDKRIAKLIKNDEKMKMKTEKFEKLKRQNEEKLEKKKYEKMNKEISKKGHGILSRATKSDKNSPTPSENSIKAKKHHGIFHHLSHHHKKNPNGLSTEDVTSIGSSKLSRTESAISVNSANSKKSDSGRSLISSFSKKKSP